MFGGGNLNRAIYSRVKTHIFYESFLISKFFVNHIVSFIVKSHSLYNISIKSQF